MIFADILFWFLMVAGALNMLATLDAYDIAIGRKE